MQVVTLSGSFHTRAPMTRLLAGAAAAPGPPRRGAAFAASAPRCRA